ncbi:MAG: LamG-like jellyroll fold domain-containing protein, partial [Nanoarchaeota archaeon]
LIYNGSHAKLFLDGVNDSGWVVAAQAGVEGIDTIGGIGSSYGMNGSIDEVEVYNRALTADEINQSYRRDFPLFGLNSSRFGANSSLTLQVEPIQSDGTAGPAVNSTPQGSIFLTIVNVTPNGTLFSYGSVVNLTANVTTSASALTVSANVTLPNGSIRVVPMTNSSSTTFRGNLSPMSLGGLYNFTVLANDSNSLLTNITSNFSINLPPSVSRVNITPFTPNNTTAVAGVWNYSDADGDAQNGTTYTWFVNGTEGWRDAGLVSYWKMDSEFGFNDTLGRNNASQNTASARPASTTGITKEAMIFDGSDDYVSTTSPVSNYPLTMSTWIKRIAGCDVLALSDSTVFTDYLSIWAGGTYFIVARSPSVNDQYDTGVAVSSGWNHIAGVFDSATDRKMYVNGVLIASRTSSVNPSYNT